MKSILARFVVVLVGLMVWTCETRADFTFTVLQEGYNVVATGSGSLNLTDLTNPVSLNVGSYVNSGLGVLYVGNDASAKLYSGVSGPGSFGNSFNTTSANFSTGDLVGISGAPGELGVFPTYVSGTAISDSATWDVATFASLGLTEGTYKYTWGTGINADSLTVQIGPMGPIATPEPSSWMLMGLGLFCLAGGYAYRRRMEVALAS